MYQREMMHHRRRIHLGLPAAPGARQFPSGKMQRPYQSWMGSPDATPGPERVEGRVCVTGANGFFGSALVRLLLSRGYAVNGTVRDASPARNQHLLSMPQAADRLRLFEANLLAPDSFGPALEGCDGLFHTASPFFVGGTNNSSANAQGEPYDEASLCEPAVGGTRGVLQAALEAGVGHVVVTASTACVYVDYGRKGLGHVYTEADWSEPEELREHSSWYALSKTLAERAALEFAAEHPAMGLSTVQPPLILGEMVSPVLNTSSKAVLSFLNGDKQQVPNECKALVDVKDVALAHLLAFEQRSPGRHLCIGGCPHWSEVAGLLRQLEPASPVPTELSETLPAATMGALPPHPTLYSNGKLERLGMQFSPLEDTIKDTVASLRQHKFYDGPL